MAMLDEFLLDPANGLMPVVGDWPSDPWAFLRDPRARQRPGGPAAMPHIPGLPWMPTEEEILAAEEARQRAARRTGGTRTMNAMLPLMQPPGDPPIDEGAVAQQARDVAARRVGGARGVENMLRPHAAPPAMSASDLDHALVDPAAEAAAARAAAAGRTGARNPVGGEQPIMPGMGLLASMLAGGGGAPAGPGIGSYPFATPPPGFADLDTPPGGDVSADDARAVAAQRVAGSVRRPGVFGRGTEPIPGIDAVANLLRTGGGAGSAGGAPGAPPAEDDPLMDFATGNEFERERPSLTNDPTSGEPVPVVTGPAATPATAALTGGRAPLSMAGGGPATMPGMPGGGGMNGMLGRIFNPNNAATFLALGAGFAGAPSIGTGMSRAFGNAVPAMAADRAFATKQSGQQATFRALIAKGVPPHEALAATQNTEIMKAVATKYFETKPRQHVTLKDSYGNDVPVTFDPNSGKYFGADGKEFNSASGQPGGTPMGNINQDLVGEEYLAQFPKDVQSAVKNYIAGNTNPATNPRRGFAETVKRVAQKYGEDTGTPITEQLYGQRRTYRNQLASGSPSSVGGARNALRQGIEHLEVATHAAEKLGNMDLWSSHLSAGANAVRGMTTTQAAKVKAFDNQIQQLAGEMGKFFSGSQGGGVHERELTRKRFEAIGSPQELAAAIESTLELMEGGLRAREQARDEIMGPNSGIELLSAADKKRIDTIREVAARMRTGDKAPSAPAAAAPKPGNYIYDGTRLVPAR